MDTNAYQSPLATPTAPRAPGGWLLVVLALEILFAALHVLFLVLLCLSATSSPSDGPIPTVHWPAWQFTGFRIQYAAGLLVRITAITTLIQFQIRSAIPLRWSQWLTPLLIWLVATGLHYYLNRGQLFGVFFYSSFGIPMLLTIATYIVHALATCLLMLAVQQNRKQWQAARH